MFKYCAGIARTIFERFLLPGRQNRMKKKILIAIAVVAAFVIALPLAFRFNKRSEHDFFATKQKNENKKEAAAGYLSQEEIDADNVTTHPAAAPGRGRTIDEQAETLSAGERPHDARDRQPAQASLGKIYIPATGSERKLEYNLAVNYQIDSLKSARAFFNQWIPRYGFLLQETASGDNNGYMTLRVRVRSANLYAALNDLDAIGKLTSENISVHDHTENAVYQQMLAAREDIRNRRRAIANANTGTASANWQATENLLSQSEDKQLATRMEEWRVGDRIGWATLTIALSLPVTPHVAPVEVPHFRNAFVGLLNLLLQLVYLGIYLIPLGLVAWLVWRASLKVIPALRRNLSGGLKPAAKDYAS